MVLITVKFVIRAFVYLLIFDVCYVDILLINHLWMFPRLTKLQLNNNIIEKIEKLDVLENLKELDLSFNKITIIENLDSLKNLEVLTLFDNKIVRIDNLHNLNKLTVLSVGNNLLNNTQDILYLRRIRSLKALNLEGNPFCETKNFKELVFAYIPQLVYYAYRMVSENDRRKCREIFKEDLTKLEAEELNERNAEQKAEETKNKEKEYFEAFVEDLWGTKFFETMYEDDKEGQAFTEIGDDIQEAYLEFQKGVCEVTNELHAVGLEQQKIRKSECADFEENVSKAKQKLISDSQNSINTFLNQRKEIFTKLELLVDLFNKNSNRKEREITSQEIEKIRVDFNELILITWNDLMKKELYLLESMEKVIGTLERNLTSQITSLIEAAQAHFTQLRNIEGTYHDVVTEVADRYFTWVSMMQAQEESQEELDISTTLLEIMSDKEIMINALSNSHENHLLVIDKREDQLISRAKSWAQEFIQKINTNETGRSRNQIIEINHFLDHQRKEFESVISNSKDNKSV